MTGIALQQTKTAPLTLTKIRQWGNVLLALAIVLIAVTIGVTFANLPADAPVLVNSTPGQLGIWLAEQSGEAAPESILGRYAKSWAASLGVARLEDAVLINTMRNGIILLTGLIALATIGGIVGLVLNASWSRNIFLIALVGFDILLFTFPVVEGDSTVSIVVGGIFLLLIVLLIAPGATTKVLGFLVVLSALLMVWESYKSFAESASYKIAVPQPNWNYTAYPTLEESLKALSAGEVQAVIIDSRDLRDADLTGLQLVETLDKNTAISGFKVIPEFPGRLGVATKADYTPTSISSLLTQKIGTVEGEFAADRFLPQQRELVLVDLTIGNDLNMPHLQKISEALLQPARRNGPNLLIEILSNAALFTWFEALGGFIVGGIMGFLLGTLFAHSRLLERGLLPYIVASQTIPILALAPIVVIWFGRANQIWLAVPTISAYLTFFPVTINTLRGLQSPSPNALELMQSYAASKWEIMWKLRFPSALPYIFTALKVSATASVVGAIIGELPSGIAEGLGRAILNFNQYYTSDPAKLWAAIFIAALVGIFFFVIVAMLERMLLPVTMREK